MFKRNFIIFAIILAAAAIVLPLFNIPLVLGNPNLGSTPITLAAVYLPWPFGIIIGLIKGISAALFTGKYLTEISAGVGDTLMAYVAFLIARRLHKALSAALGQVSRLILTSGMVALGFIVALAAGWITPASVPVSGLTSSAAYNFFAIWKSMTCPAIALSMAVNLVVSVLVIVIAGKRIERYLAG